MARILVIDDLWPNQDVVMAMLMQAGHEVTRASSQEEALAVAGEGLDCFICDLMLRKKASDIPDSDTLGGVRLIQRLRGDQATKDKPIIVMTKRGDRSHIMDILKPLGIAGYLEFPFREGDLTAAVSQALAGAKKGGGRA